MTPTMYAGATNTCSIPPSGSSASSPLQLTLTMLRDIDLNSADQVFVRIRPRGAPRPRRRPAEQPAFRRCRALLPLCQLICIGDLHCQFSHLGLNSGHGQVVEEMLVVIVL
jgi:hypothetical protein